MASEPSEWIDWAESLSTAPPVSPETMVEIRYLDDGRELEDYGPADSFYWKHDGDSDIIAYRVVTAA